MSISETDMPGVRDWNDVGTLGIEGRPARLIRFVLGYEPIPESLSLEGGDPARFLLEPVTAVAVVYDEGAWVLLDSGFNVDTVRDEKARGEHFNFDGYAPVVPPGDPLADQVIAAGLDWADLAACAISHVHFDHTGGLRFVAGRAPAVFQRAEWDYAVTDATIRDAVSVDDFLRPDLDVVLLDGDTEFAPGITALDTRGHTPGHQSFAIELQGRTVVLACDAADLRRNITESIACGSTIRPGDAVDARIAARRLHELDLLDGVEVWPGHDPDWWAWRDTGAL
ncbi:N-acyl homoserine lactonase family protein [Amnibacterium flavum]|uniref:MBL fold metallo-hydrolase n=1 Tax=Amnibacterium flavum TaxID=2173173 RepID=A0A2V1HUU1_9MICO|nr:N-acyl homoserine lactonase family protein [Amnibacterium flavum]PVZ94077.1 MBL fold metallo-hydrolase [Amnibacterium flavum]